MYTILSSLMIVINEIKADLKLEESAKALCDALESRR